MPRFNCSAPQDRPKEALRLVFVGRLLEDKGVRELAEAMRLLRPRYPKLELTLVGELGAANRTAISKDELDGWVRGGLLTYAGRAKDVRPYLKAADAVILPSYREGMQRALFEASHARPLRAADVPGCRELVRDGMNGLWFEVRSPQAIAEAIERLIAAGPEQRRKWAAKSRSDCRGRI